MHKTGFSASLTVHSDPEVEVRWLRWLNASTVRRAAHQYLETA